MIYFPVNAWDIRNSIEDNQLLTIRMGSLTLLGIGTSTERYFLSDTLDREKQLMHLNISLLSVSLGK